MCERGGNYLFNNLDLCHTFSHNVIMRVDERKADYCWARAE